MAGASAGTGSAALADFSLREARERARKARQMLSDGIDPVEAKKQARAAAALAAAKTVTFEEAAKQYYAQHNAKWNNRKHAAQFISTMSTYAFPKIGRLLGRRYRHRRGAALHRAHMAEQDRDG